MNVQPPTVVSVENDRAVVLDVPKERGAGRHRGRGPVGGGCNNVPGAGTVPDEPGRVLRACAAPAQNAVAATSAVVASNLEETNLQPGCARDVALRHIVDDSRRGSHPIGPPINWPSWAAIARGTN